MAAVLAWISLSVRIIGRKCRHLRCTIKSIWTRIPNPPDAVVKVGVGMVTFPKIAEFEQKLYGNGVFGGAFGLGQAAGALIIPATPRKWRIPLFLSMAIRQRKVTEIPIDRPVSTVLYFIFLQYGFATDRPITTLGQCVSSLASMAILMAQGNKLRAEMGAVLLTLQTSLARFLKSGGVTLIRVSRRGEKLSLWGNALAALIRHVITHAREICPKGADAIEYGFLEVMANMDAGMSPIVSEAKQRVLKQLAKVFPDHVSYNQLANIYVANSCACIRSLSVADHNDERLAQVMAASSAITALMVYLSFGEDMKPEGATTVASGPQSGPVVASKANVSTKVPANGKVCGPVLVVENLTILPVNDLTKGFNVANHLKVASVDPEDLSVQVDGLYIVEAMLTWNTIYVPEGYTVGINSTADIGYPVVREVKGCPMRARNVSGFPHPYLRYASLKEMFGGWYPVFVQQGDHYTVAIAFKQPVCRPIFGEQVTRFTEAILVGEVIPIPSKLSLTDSTPVLVPYLTVDEGEGKVGCTLGAKGGKHVFTRSHVMIAQDQLVQIAASVLGALIAAERDPESLKRHPAAVQQIVAELRRELGDSRVDLTPEAKGDNKRGTRAIRNNVDRLAGSYNVNVRWTNAKHKQLVSIARRYVEKHDARRASHARGQKAYVQQSGDEAKYDAAWNIVMGAHDDDEYHHNLYTSDFFNSVDDADLDPAMLEDADYVLREFRRHTGDDLGYDEEVTAGRKDADQFVAHLTSEARVDDTRALQRLLPRDILDAMNSKVPLDYGANHLFATTVSVLLQCEAFLSIVFRKQSERAKISCIAHPGSVVLYTPQRPAVVTADGKSGPVHEAIVSKNQALPTASLCKVQFNNTVAAGFRSKSHFVVPSDLFIKTLPSTVMGHKPREQLAMVRDAISKTFSLTNLEIWYQTGKRSSSEDGWNSVQFPLTNVDFLVDGFFHAIPDVKEEVMFFGCVQFLAANASESLKCLKLPPIPAMATVRDVKTVSSFHHGTGILISFKDPNLREHSPADVTCVNYARTSGHIAHNGNTKEGTCGSPIVDEQGVVVGVHVAGGALQKLNYAVPLSRHDYQTLGTAVFTSTDAYGRCVHHQSTVDVPVAGGSNVPSAHYAEFVQAKPPKVFRFDVHRVSDVPIPGSKTYSHHTKGAVGWLPRDQRPWPQEDWRDYTEMPDMVEGCAYAIHPGSTDSCVKELARGVRSTSMDNDPAVKRWCEGVESVAKQIVRFVDSEEHVAKFGKHTRLSALPLDGSTIERLVRFCAMDAHSTRTRWDRLFRGKVTSAYERLHSRSATKGELVRFLDGLDPLGEPEDGVEEKKKERWAIVTNYVLGVYSWMGMTDKMGMPGSGMPLFVMPKHEPYKKKKLAAGQHRSIQYPDLAVTLLELYFTNWVNSAGDILSLDTIMARCPIEWGENWMLGGDAGKTIRLSERFGANDEILSLDVSGWDRSLHRSVIETMYRNIMGDASGQRRHEAVARCLAYGLTGHGIYLLDAHPILGIQFKQRESVVWCSGTAKTLSGNCIMHCGLLRSLGLKGFVQGDDGVVSNPDVAVAGYKAVGLTLKDPDVRVGSFNFTKRDYDIVAKTVASTGDSVEKCLGKGEFIGINNGLEGIRNTYAHLKNEVAELGWTFRWEPSYEVQKHLFDYVKMRPDMRLVIRSLLDFAPNAAVPPLILYRDCKT